MELGCLDDIRQAATSIQPFITPLASSFFGALFAVWLAEKRDARKKTRDRVNAINKTVATVGLYVDRIITIKRQVLDVLKDNPHRHILMKPIHTLEKPSVSIEFESISFLLENDCRNIVPRLVAAEEYYSTLVTLINRRSEIAYGEVQKRLEDAGLTIEDSLAVNQFEAVVGPRLIVTVKGMTDSIYEMTDDLLNIMLVLAKELGAEAEKIFPKDIILKLSLDPDKETQK